MTEIKTRENKASVNDFLNDVSNERKQSDAFAILKLMQEITNEEPKMWGNSIVGFGNIHYRYSSGREGDWFLTGFSPRKQSLTIYLISGFSQFEDELSRLGKHKTSVSCLYINKLEDVNVDVLRELIEKSIEELKKRGYGC